MKPELRHSLSRLRQTPRDRSPPLDHIRGSQATDFTSPRESRNVDLIGS
jgi:hypothetical protein